MANILLIDDDPAIRSLFSQFLEEKGHQVRTSKDGTEGLDHLAEDFPDLIITDIMMPEMDGLELISLIRGYAPHAPILAISGGMKGSLNNLLPAAKTFGACKVLQKPISLTHLNDAVKKLLPSGGVDAS